MPRTAKRKGFRSASPSLRRFIRGGSKESVVNAFEDLRAEYRMALPSRFRSVSLGGAATGVDADYHARSDSKLMAMIEFARHIAANHALVGVALRRLCTNVLRKSGLQYQPQTGSRELNALLKTKWLAWADDPLQADIRGKMSFRRQARATLRSILIDGDVLMVPRVEGCLQTIEAHRIRSPKNTLTPDRKYPVVNGCEIHSATGRARRWFIARPDVSLRTTVQRVGDTDTLPAWNDDGTPHVFHCAFPERMTQTRGISSFNRFGDSAGQIDDITFAWLVREQVAACIAFIEQDDGIVPTDHDDDDRPLGDYSQVASADSLLGDEVDMKPGKILRARPGKKLVGFAPNMPGEQSLEHAMLHVAIMAVNLDIPVQILMLDPTQTNFSGWKGATNEAEDRWREIAQDLAECLHRPTINWMVSRWLIEDGIIASLAQEPGVDVYRHQWSSPRKESIQPVEDATADTMRLNGGQTSHRRFSHERYGCEWADLYAEIIDDRGDAIEAAIERANEINKLIESPDERISWRDLMPLAMPEGTKLSISTTANEQNTDQQGAAA